MTPSSWFRQGHAYGVKMKTDFNRSQLLYLPLKNSKTEISPFSYQLGNFRNSSLFHNACVVASKNKGEQKGLYGKEI